MTVENVITPDRYIDKTLTQFAIFCDDCAMSVDEGYDLAERLGDALKTVADHRRSYVGEKP